jgi:hypothetical protein
VLEETGLGSQHAILGTHQAAAALSGVEEIEELDEEYKTSRPEFTAETVKYDTRTMTLFDDGTVSLSTIDDRIRCDLVLPDEEDGYQHQYLNDEDWELTESTLSRRDGDYSYISAFANRSPRSGSNSRVTKRTGQLSALTSASSTSLPRVRRPSRPAESFDTAIGSSSGYVAPFSRLGHNPHIGRFSR